MNDIMTQLPARRPAVEVYSDGREPGIVANPGTTFGDLAAAFAALPADAVVTSVYDAVNGQFEVIGVRPEDLNPVRAEIAAASVGTDPWFDAVVGASLTRFPQAAAAA